MKDDVISGLQRFTIFAIFAAAGKQGLAVGEAKGHYEYLAHSFGFNKSGASSVFNVAKELYHRKLLSIRQIRRGTRLNDVFTITESGAKEFNKTKKHLSDYIEHISNLVIQGKKR